MLFEYETMCMYYSFFDISQRPQETEKNQNYYIKRGQKRITFDSATYLFFS